MPKPLKCRRLVVCDTREPDRIKVILIKKCAKYWHKLPSFWKAIDATNYNLALREICGTKIVPARVITDIVKAMFLNLGSYLDPHEPDANNGLTAFQIVENHSGVIQAAKQELISQFEGNEVFKEYALQSPRFRGMHVSNKDR